MPTSQVIFSAAVEGPVDEVVLNRIVGSLGASLGGVFGRNGKNGLLKQLPNYNQAAHHSPWIVLVDLDQDASCAPPARVRWLATPAPQMCFRIAVREIESWLLADRESLASFLSVAQSRIPAQPETLDNPKETLVNLARRSRRRDIQIDMVPRPGSGRSVGPAYTSRLIEYAGHDWRPEVAINHADSLLRLHNRVTDLIERMAK